MLCIVMNLKKKILKTFENKNMNEKVSHACMEIIWFGMWFKAINYWKAKYSSWERMNVLHGYKLRIKKWTIFRILTLMRST